MPSNVNGVTVGPHLPPAERATIDAQLASRYPDLRVTDAGFTTTGACYVVVTGPRGSAATLERTTVDGDHSTAATDTTSGPPGPDARTPRTHERKLYSSQAHPHVATMLWPDPTDVDGLVDFLADVLCAYRARVSPDAPILPNNG